MSAIASPPPTGPSSLITAKPLPPIKPRWVGPALAGWASWGKFYWIHDGLAEIKLMYDLGFRRVAIPFSLFDKTGDALIRFVNAVAYALSLGMDVYAQIHVDGNDNVNCNAPWDQANDYEEQVQDMASALQVVLRYLVPGTTTKTGPTGATVSSTTPPTFTIVIGNELTGSPDKDWPTILTLFDTLLPNCAKALHQKLKGVKVYVPYMGDEQAGYLAAGMTQAGMMPNLLRYGGLPSSSILPIYEGVDLHYLLETMLEAQQYIKGATAVSLLSLFKGKYELPVGIGEFDGVPLNPDGSVGTEVSLAMVTATVNLGIPCHYWQWYAPGGLSLKGNEPVLAALGFAPEVTVAA